MINLLMVTLEFPPVNSTGCYRYLKFLRYLQNRGINPIVIAPTVESSLRLWENRKADETLMAQVPENTRIIRVPLPGNAYVVKKKIGLNERIDFYTKYKDNASELWKPAIMKAIKELYQTVTPDILYVSPPPFSLCKLAADISIDFKLPLLLDMRDDWIINKGNPFPTYWHFKKIYSELRRALQQATLINVVTPQLADMSCKAYPDLSRSRFSVITNGFDLENPEFQSFQTGNLGEKDMIRIGYSGEFYFNPETHRNTNLKWWKRKGIRKLNYLSGISIEDWSYRSPLYFFRTLLKLFEKHPELKNKIRFEHIGNTPGWLFQWVKEMDLEKNFHAHGFVSKSENLRIQQELDALLVTSEKVIDGEHYCISSKVFDAFLMQKPVLAFVTEGICKEVLDKSGCSILFDPDNLTESVKQMEDFIYNGRRFNPDTEYLKRFTPGELADRLVEEIHGIYQKQKKESSSVMA